MAEKTKLSADDLIGRLNDESELIIPVDGGFEFRFALKRNYDDIQAIAQGAMTRWRQLEKQKAHSLYDLRPKTQDGAIRLFTVAQLCTGVRAADGDEWSQFTHRDWLKLYAKQGWIILALHARLDAALMGALAEADEVLLDEAGEDSAPPLD